MDLDFVQDVIIARGLIGAGLGVRVIGLRVEGVLNELNALLHGERRGHGYLDFEDEGAFAYGSHGRVSEKGFGFHWRVSGVHSAMAAEGLLGSPMEMVKRVSLEISTCAWKQKSWIWVMVVDWGTAFSALSWSR
jgi:hypothetical protein